MLKIADLLAELDEGERRALSGAITEGIHQARLAASACPTRKSSRRTWCSS